MVALSVLFLSAIALFLHPYVTYPLSLRVLRWVRGRTPLAMTDPEPTSYAVVCCAYNEKKDIKEKIENMLAIKERLPNCQILVHSDGSTDGTNEILLSYQDRITVSIAEVRGGKSAGMNRLLSMTDAEVVIFTDANVMIDLDRITGVGRYFRDPRVGCATGRLIYINKAASQTAMIGTMYRGFEESLKELETDTGTIVYTDGTLFAIRRKLFKPVPPDITDDFHTALTVLCAGYRNVSAHDLVAYEQAASVRRDEVRRRVRIGCRVFNCHRLFWPKLVQLDGLTLYKYVSHKLVRWLSGYVLLFSALIGAMIAGTLLGAIGIIAYLLILGSAYFLATTFTIPILSPFCEAIMHTMATAYGVMLSLRGERFQTWTIASSSRK
jgi:cellulose synthase/poly-beta-1,6-N-acetylglucosamine synthase-like glycosyltransferase